MMHFSDQDKMLKIVPSKEEGRLNIGGNGMCGEQVRWHEDRLTCVDRIAPARLAGIDVEDALPDSRVGSLSYGAQTQQTPVAPTGTPHAPVSEVTEHPGVVGLAI